MPSPPLELGLCACRLGAGISGRISEETHALGSQPHNRLILGCGMLFLAFPPAAFPPPLPGTVTLSPSNVR